MKNNLNFGLVALVISLASFGASAQTGNAPTGTGDTMRGGGTVGTGSTSGPDSSMGTSNSGSSGSSGTSNGSSYDNSNSGSTGTSGMGTMGSTGSGGTAGSSPGTMSSSGNTGAASSGNTSNTANWNEQSSYWRTQYPSRSYYSKSRTYSSMEPAYRYGVDLYNQNPGKRYEDLDQSQLSTGWNAARGNSNLSWSNAQWATRDAYNRLYDSRTQ